MRDDPDKLFSGSIAQLYEQYLVPLIFQSYAADMANRVAQRQPSAVLEIAAGTGVDRIEENEFGDVVTQTLAEMFPHDPPRFLARTPHGYHQLQDVVADLAAAGFKEQPTISTLALRSRAEEDAAFSAFQLCDQSCLKSRYT